MKHVIKKLCDILNNLNIDYALIGGIAAILYGIQRTTLDIDVLIGTRSRKDIISLVSALKDNGFEVVLEEALQALKERTHFTAIHEGAVLIDFKFASSPLDFSTLDRKRYFVLNSTIIYISPLEELIAAKLKILGSLKDIEDALQLMYIFHDRIDWKLLTRLTNKDSFKFINRLLKVILDEFSKERRVVKKIRELESLKSKIEALVSFKQ